MTEAFTPKTRIQRKNTGVILEAALDVFSAHGFRGATLDQIAEVAKPIIILTGGEPLTRRGVPDLARRLGALPGLEDLSLSTNASQLARHAEALKQAGVARINVSLDSLNAERFREITSGKLEKVLAGLMAAKAAGLETIYATDKVEERLQAALPG